MSTRTLWSITGQTAINVHVAMRYPTSVGFEAMCGLAGNPSAAQPAGLGAVVLELVSAISGATICQFIQGANERHLEGVDMASSPKW